MAIYTQVDRLNRSESMVRLHFRQVSRFGQALEKVRQASLG